MTNPWYDKEINSKEAHKEVMKREKIKRLKIEMEEEAPSINHVWRRAYIHGIPRTYMTQKGREFKERLSNIVPKDFIPIEKDCRVDIKLTFPTKRKSDIDNRLKVILDGLNNKAYIDDSQITELHVYKTYEKNKPRIEIEVIEL